MKRVTRDDWIEEGFRILSADGDSALTVDALCQRLRRTKGSFYHHFADRADFVRKLLGYWEREYNDALREQLLAVPDVRARVALMQKGALLQQDVDAAIRHLARSDPYVAAVQRRVERKRERPLARTFREMGMPTERASRLAGIGLAIAAGTQQLERRVDRRRFAGLIAEYRRWVDAQARR